MTLLPANATDFERAASEATARADAIPAPAGMMWDPARIPLDLVEHLAWALSVDDWDSDWSEVRKREIVAGVVALHRIKGTRQSVADALAMQGYGTATIIEDRELPRIGDADLEFGGDWVFGPDDPSWADYWVEILAPIPRRDADRLAARLGNVAPARCRLRGIALTGVYYTFGDGLWLIGDDVAFGNVYTYEVS